MSDPSSPSAKRRLRRRTLAAVTLVGAIAIAFMDAPYAEVDPGPTPELSFTILAANTTTDVDPTFGHGGQWHVTTINATPLPWWKLAVCKVTDSCDVFPMATGSSARTSADQAMARSVADAAALAKTWVGADDHAITMAADLGEVGGPSAGLMLTLAFIDAATDGDLTGGRVIAGTGTINSLSEVGPISGIEFKVQGAHAAGADVFFAPELEADDARDAAQGTGVDVVSAQYLVDAIEWLCDNGGQSTVCTSPALTQAKADKVAR